MAVKPLDAVLGRLEKLPRTASLIEGLGTRYDPHFNAIEFAAPIALRLRGRIMASLRGDASAKTGDWVVELGGLLGDVVGVVQRAGKEIAGIVAERWVTRGIPEVRVSGR